MADIIPLINQHALTAADLQHMTFPPLRSVIPGFLTEGTTVLAGKPKLGKSWLGMDWCISVAIGGCALGKIECEQGDVLYAALEDNPRRLQRRLRQVIPDRQAWPDRLTLRTSMKRIDEGLLDELRAWANASENPRLIVIDTLAKVRPPAKRSDNPYEADYRAVSPFTDLAAELQLAILIVHHTRKMDADDPLDMVSGTTGLTGGVDSVMVLTRDGQGTILTGRGRDLDDFESAVKLDSSGRWTLLGDADEVRRSKERNCILAAVERLGEAGPKEIADASGLKESNVKVLVGKMAEAGELEKVERGRYRLPS
ncbi:MULTISPECIES: AAA family ATPase [unclassified Mesorhizobium]|uniref:AAA family ATPase n=1 Tax=unclassified Mesorhizobium TaxID=325217 RepID=UPI000FCCCE42|nr:MULTISPECIES: AAA family ATPase [unclassified Mesorhizobium]RVD54536.1 recombinase A [Mesorhizobium sp. M2D.F.Ca.ET.140.01.1.1]TGP69389.1 recombinase A [Mesorhizobium sp. M2D.F.Ca.ET.224.01.1.1]TGP86609.1 recombinase A [bacterium M00.F.Ca.ET.222.01.1.1]